MPKQQSKNTINRIQGNLSPQEPSLSATESPEYFNTVETQGKNLINNFLKMKEVLEEERKKIT